MRNETVTIGIVIMVVGVILTFITLGIGIICTWPLILVGLILLIVGAVLPEKERHYQDIKSEGIRYCTDCGKQIPFDAKFCPYCNKKFEEF